MDMLRKELAPIASAAWHEIESQAVRYFKSTLTLRQVVDLVGPKGVDYMAVPSGRLSQPAEQPEGSVRYGVCRLQPLVEIRSPFELNLWELDNAARGAADIDLQPLEKAAWELAKFEEEAVYLGLKEAGIEPLQSQCDHDPIDYGGKLDQLYPSVVAGLTTLRKAMIEGPCALVVRESEWNYLMSTVVGRPLIQHVEAVIGGPVLFSPFIPAAMLVSLRGGDIEMVLGRDIDIGYSSHSSQTVSLYFTETFTFRVLDPTVFLFLT